MRKKLQLTVLIIICNFILLTILSFVFTSSLEWSFIGKWGLLSGFVLLIGALPLFKAAHFGGSGIEGSQTPEIPPDEHLHYKIQQQYEKENATEIEKNRIYQDVFTIAGVTIIVLSIFMIQI